MKSFQVFSSPREIYRKMLHDIEGARKSIFLETYIYGNDSVGREFRNALASKAAQGVKVLVIVDSWGSMGINKSFFKDLTDFGGKVKFFKKIRYALDLVGVNNERNHRKLFVIDDEIAYLGSNNINANCLDWRELALRIEGSLASHFAQVFLDNWMPSRRLKKLRSVFHRGFLIVTDSPKIHRSQWRFLSLIRGAKKEILIETPYFIPSLRIRRALASAVERGVEVKLILPHISDVKIMDIMRNRYLGALHRRGVKIYYYLPKVLHSKLLLVDGKFFFLGSSNVDYRSFMHSFEINLIGRDEKMVRALEEFYRMGLEECKRFDYREWKSRSSINRVMEIILHRLRGFF